MEYTVINLDNINFHNKISLALHQFFMWTYRQTSRHGKVNRHYFATPLCDIAENEEEQMKEVGRKVDEQGTCRRTTIILF
jgi:hypothetical protein